MLHALPSPAAQSCAVVGWLLQCLSSQGGEGLWSQQEPALVSFHRGDRVNGFASL